VGQSLWLIILCILFEKRHVYLLVSVRSLPIILLGSLPKYLYLSTFYTDLKTRGLGYVLAIAIFVLDLGVVPLPMLHIVFLALIQGITEFLPISSQAHLQLLSSFSDWADQGLMIDVAVHVGTLGAVIVYFWRDLWAMITGVLRLAKGSWSEDARLAGFLIIGTLPAIAAGYFVSRYYPGGIRSIEIIGWTTLGFGILLYIADKVGMTVISIKHVKISDIIVIGCAQALALIPGTSRSGITMTAARILGIERRESARLSMLLSIPVIIGAGSLQGWKLYQSGNIRLSDDALIAAALSFVAALLVMAGLMAWLKKSTYTPFVIYRIILGSILLSIVYGWIE
jgi:undecaprenyl-diphosphatase